MRAAANIMGRIQGASAILEQVERLLSLEVETGEINPRDAKDVERNLRIVQVEIGKALITLARPQAMVPEIEGQKA